MHPLKSIYYTLASLIMSIVLLFIVAILTSFVLSEIISLDIKRKMESTSKNLLTEEVERNIKANREK